MASSNIIKVAMARLTQHKRNLVKDETHQVLHRLLRFHVSYNSLSYIHRKSSNNWRDLEEELHIEYPIKGAGLLANRTNLRLIDGAWGGFLHTDVDLFPGEVPSELERFPYKPAAAAYTFTLLEGYGDNIAEIVNPGNLKDRQAWHHGVYGNTNLSDSQGMKKAKKGFATPFGRGETQVPRYAVERLVEIKAARNEFMHEGYFFMDFDDFYAKVLATVASVYFLVLPSEKILSAYPYHDYDGRFGLGDPNDTLETPR
jgi:hypothetical protein